MDEYTKLMYSIGVVDGLMRSCADDLEKSTKLGCFSYFQRFMIRRKAKKVRKFAEKCLTDFKAAAEVIPNLPEDQQIEACYRLSLVVNPFVHKIPQWYQGIDNATNFLRLVSKEK